MSDEEDYKERLDSIGEKIAFNHLYAKLMGWETRIAKWHGTVIMIHLQPDGSIIEDEIDVPFYDDDGKE